MYRVASIVVALVLGACASPDRPMPEGLRVVVEFKSPEQIAAAAKRAEPHDYKADALAWAPRKPGEPCRVWLRAGLVSPWLIAHELQHCVGRKHDARGRWIN